MKADIMMPAHERTPDQLKRLQGLPLIQKVDLTERRLSQFYNYYGGKVYISFSGGKDSTVLLHIARKLFPEIKAAFIDTGLEYPEIRDFVKQTPNVDWVRPDITFKAVIDKYGYPIISKEVAQKLQEIQTTKSDKLRNKRLYGDDKGNGRLPKKWQYLINAPFKISGKCCDALKKRPVKKYERLTGLHPVVGTMAAESRLRKTQWFKGGCNSFQGNRPMSAPISFWTEEDVLEYLKVHQVPYSKIYDMGEKRTGCMFCMFGCQFDDEDGMRRFERMKISHPKQYRYCMENLGLKDVISYINKEIR
jgi:3'-phosphoadenosine 5'-phosphosulfate sulfotransferase (PAPS reductase)/FAD synthetase